MKVIPSDDLKRCSKEFEVLATSAQSQIASMILQPGAVSGEYGNEHPKSDQTLYVLSGTAQAKVSNQTVELKTGDTILIEAGEDHQIINSGSEVLRTLNLYAPSAY